MTARLPSPFTADPVYLMAQDDFCQDTEEFAGWIQNARGDRQPAGYFGPISNQELLRDYLLNRRANDEQLAEAAKELRRRYVLENASAIADRMTALEAA